MVVAILRGLSWQKKRPPLLLPFVLSYSYFTCWKRLLALVLLVVLSPQSSSRGLNLQSNNGWRSLEPWTYIHQKVSLARWIMGALLGSLINVSQWLKMAWENHYGLALCFRNELLLSSLKVICNPFSFNPRWKEGALLVNWPSCQQSAKKA